MQGRKISKARNQLCLPPDFTLVYCLAYSSAMKKEAICTSKTTVDIQRTTRRYIPEDSTLHNQLCENIKAYVKIYSCLKIKYSLYHTMYSCSLTFIVNGNFHPHLRTPKRSHLWSRCSNRVPPHDTSLALPLQQPVWLQDRIKNAWSPLPVVIRSGLNCNWIQVDSDGFSRWCITLRINRLLDFGHRPVF
jgi:hypothetical protein